MKKLNVKLTFIQECLGTACNDKDVHREFIASKSPDAKKIEEEIDAIGIDEYIEKQMTVFPRDADGNPIFWDYQIRGFFKDTCGALQRMKGEDMAKESCKIKAYKKVIDGCIQVVPRRIKIDMHGGSVDSLQRPLRAETAKGERIALANSEMIPEGSTIEFTVICPEDKEAAVKEWLNYGEVFRGIGQWRNAGFGRFTWEEIG